MNIAVIGAGAYGSYTIDVLQNKYPDAKITLFEVGNKHIKTEEEIGFKSNILNAPYAGLSKGRYFGFGGSTAKWGGQILLFSKNDFKQPSPFLKEIVDLNEKYREQVFSKFTIQNAFTENYISENLFTKTGVWLGYFNRNLFKYFKIAKRKNVTIISLARVIKMEIADDKSVNRIIYIQNGVQKEAGFDYYFLTAGAFESHRILLNSGLVKDKQISFSDHLSQKIFKIKGSTKIGSDDFAFKVNGTSLITKRIIGEIDGVSFFANPIFNSEFPFFQNLKKILFKQEINFKIIKSVIADIQSCFAFGWSLLIKNQIYVYKNEWYLYIDIENPIGKNTISLCEQLDKYNDHSLNVDFKIDNNVLRLYENAKEQIKELLIKHQVQFEECNSQIDVEKSEDTYHPFGMLCNFSSCSEYFNQYKNMLVVNTGILPRAGGINPTAAVFPLIEEYVSRNLN